MNISLIMLAGAIAGYSYMHQEGGAEGSEPAAHVDTVKCTCDTHLQPYLSIREILDEGRRIALDDGSEWKVTFDEESTGTEEDWQIQEDASHWAGGDKIAIQDYALFNVAKKERAPVKKEIAPSSDYANCLLVIDYDPLRNHLITSDGTVWKPLTRIKAWQIGDALTLMKFSAFPAVEILWNHSADKTTPVIKVRESKNP